MSFEREIDKPMHSDFIINNINGVQGNDGMYFHFTDVIKVLKLWDNMRKKSDKYDEHLYTDKDMQNFACEFLLKFDMKGDKTTDKYLKDWHNENYKPTK